MNIQKAWNAIVNQFVNSDEPKVEQRCDSDGNCYYRVTNPMTRKSNTFGSEQEIRIWLDQQHY